MARSPSRSERIAAAREKQRRLAATTHRTATIAQQSAASPPRIESFGHGERRTPPPNRHSRQSPPGHGGSDAASPDERTHSFLKRGAGRGAGALHRRGRGRPAGQRRPRPVVRDESDLAELRVQDVDEFDRVRGREAEEIDAAARRTEERMSQLLQTELTARRAPERHREPDASLPPPSGAGAQGSIDRLLTMDDEISRRLEKFAGLDS